MKAVLGLVFPGRSWQNAASFCQDLPKDGRKYGFLRTDLLKRAKCGWGVSSCDGPTVELFSKVEKERSGEQVSYARQAENIGRVRRSLASAVTVALAVLPATAGAQSAPLPQRDVTAIYQRLLPEIEKIKIFDNHAHPGYADDPDVDAMAATPGSTPFRLRDDNPELVVAAKSLFGYPYHDLSPEHSRWLLAKKAELKKSDGREYFNRILDQLGIEASAANRVAMPGYLDPARFLWVVFVDSFFFPFDNRDFSSRNPDEAIFIPLQEKVLHRYMAQASLASLPPDFSGYLAFITKVLEQDKARGAIAIKFEAAYFRSLSFDDPPVEEASAVYGKYRGGGTPSPQEYKAFQDYVFRYLVREGGRLRLPVHIHTLEGIGDYFHFRDGDVFNLENVLRDPRYLGTTFVLLHGGYPYERAAVWLTAMKNVYIGSSLMELILYPSEFKQVLKEWLEVYPDKIMYGSDAFPFTEAMGAEEAYWIAVHSARTALAAALAEMVAEDEVTEVQARELARGYLHDNAVRLYGRR